MIAKVIWNAMKTVSGMVPRQRLHGDPGKEQLAESTHEQAAFVEGDAVAPEGPQNAHEPGNREALHEHRKHVLAAHHPRVEERQSGNGHEKHERGRGQHPRGIARAQLVRRRRRRREPRRESCGGCAKRHRRPGPFHTLPAHWSFLFKFRSRTSRGADSPVPPSQLRQNGLEPIRQDESDVAGLRRWFAVASARPGFGSRPGRLRTSSAPPGQRERAGSDATCRESSYPGKRGSAKRPGPAVHVLVCSPSSFFR